MKKSILRIIKKMANEPLKFPCGWTDVIIGDISFNVYFNEKRDYFSFNIDYPGKDILKFTLYHTGEIEINGTLDKIYTLEEVLSALRVIDKSNFDEIKAFKIIRQKIKDKEKEKKEIIKEIGELKNSIKK